MKKIQGGNGLEMGWVKDLPVDGESHEEKESKQIDLSCYLFDRKTRYFLLLNYNICISLKKINTWK